MHHKLLKAILLFGLLLFWNFSQSQTLRSSTHFDGDLPNIELKPDYGFVFPVNADVINESNYSPAFSNRYFMSLFGPRYLSTSSSSIGYYDFHQGADVTHTLSWNGVNYDPNTLYHIVCNCDGVINSITDSTDVYLETTGNGRSVRVKCDSTFRNNNAWGNIFINYRHLSDLYTLTDSAKNEAADAVRISKGDTIGIVGASGITSTVHLHTSIQRYETGTNTTNYKNVHPYRIYSPDTAKHLHRTLNNATFKLLGNWTDSAIFRFYIPYNQMCVKRIEITNDSYSNTFDFEDVSDSTNRDNHALITGFELFAYSFNRGSTALSRYNSTKGSMPAVYPASPNRTLGNIYPITADSTVYILDVKLNNLTTGYDTLDFVIKLSDIYGNVVLGDYGTVWNGSTWSDGVPTSSINAIIASSTSPGAVSCRNLTINKDITLNLGANDINISGNVSNYGNGIAGTGTINFNKTGTALLFENTISYGSVVNIASGTTLSTNSLLTLTAASASSYGQLIGDGTVSGNVKVQAYLAGIDGNTARYFHLGSPCTNASLSDFNEGNIMIANSGSTGSVWEWDADNAQWSAPSSLNNVATNGRGYAIYAGTTTNGTFIRGTAGTIELNGSVATTDVNRALTYNNGQATAVTFVGGSAESDTEGWNLVANPFPAIYDWDSQTLPTDMGSAIYRYNGSSYSSYTKGVGSGSRYIPPFQGFFIQLTANTPSNLTFAENNRVTGQTAILGKVNSYSIDGVDLFVESINTTVKDQLFVGYDVNSSSGFDLEYDAHKLLNESKLPNVFTRFNTDTYSICRVHPNDGIQSFPIFLSFKNHGESLLFKADLNRLQSYTTVLLEDLKTNTLHDLSLSDYTFSQDTTFKTDRFILHFTGPKNVGLLTPQQNNSWFAYAAENGVTINKGDLKNVEIRIFNISGQLIFKSTATNLLTTIPLEEKGVYTLELSSSKSTNFKKFIH